MSLVRIQGSQPIKHLPQGLVCSIGGARPFFEGVMGFYLIREIYSGIVVKWYHSRLLICTLGVQLSPVPPITALVVHWLGYQAFNLRKGVQFSSRVPNFIQPDKVDDMKETIEKKCCGIPVTLVFKPTSVGCVFVKWKCPKCKKEETV